MPIVTTSDKCSIPTVQLNQFVLPKIEPPIFTNYNRPQMDSSRRKFKILRRQKKLLESELSSNTFALVTEPTYHQELFHLQEANVYTDNPDDFVQPKPKLA
jgi:hypothetical protein